MQARIYMPSKSSMQSGRAKYDKWVLEYVPTTARHAEGLMGWISSGDTLNQVKVQFETLDEAEIFAKGRGLQYTIEQPQLRHAVKRTYMDNFSYKRPAKSDTSVAR